VQAATRDFRSGDVSEYTKQASCGNAIASATGRKHVSVGTTRTMIFRTKGEQQPSLQKPPLVHGSMFTVSLNTNKSFSHRIKILDSQGTDEPRISLTLRYIGTCYHPETGAVWGIGAPNKSRKAAIISANWIQSLS